MHGLSSHNVHVDKCIWMKYAELFEITFSPLWDDNLIQKWWTYFEEILTTLQLTIGRNRTSYVSVIPSRTKRLLIWSERRDGFRNGGIGFAAFLGDTTKIMTFPARNTALGAVSVSLSITKPKCISYCAVLINTWPYEANRDCMADNQFSWNSQEFRYKIFKIYHF